MKKRSLPAAIAFYLESRRRLGFALRSEGALLENLLRYARQVGHRGPLTTELALDWAQLPPPAHRLQRARRLTAVGHFARFWATFDPRTQLPPVGLFGSPYSPRHPVHIYQPEEIRALLVAARQLSPPERSRTFTALFGLLACTGLRISEALQLELADWDPAEGVLTIRHAKFDQSRSVPLAPSAAAALQAHVRARAQAFPKAPHSALFLDSQGRRLTYRQVRNTFAALRQRLHWQHLQPRPRLHDLRHTFTVERLVGWYRQGQEQLNAKILSLAVYLGHRNIRHTYWYLTAVPELLALGSARGAKALAPQKGAAHA